LDLLDDYKSNAGHHSVGNTDTIFHTGNATNGIAMFSSAWAE